MDGVNKQRYLNESTSELGQKPGLTVILKLRELS